MPISHEHRFAFIHVPKTGGTSMMQALREADVAMEFDRNEYVSVPGYERTYVQLHWPASLLRTFVADELWAAYFKFAFVRNPWDLGVSLYHYVRAIPNLPGDPEHMSDTRKLILRSPDFDYFIRHWEQGDREWTHYLLDRNGELEVDFVGRFEHLERDVATVCNKIGIALTLPRLNASEHTSYRDYYTAETRDIVGRLFTTYTERFDYAF